MTPQIRAVTALAPWLWPRFGKPASNSACARCSWRRVPIPIPRRLDERAGFAENGRVFMSQALASTVHESE